MKREDIGINKTSHGFKVTSHFGNLEEGFFGSMKEAEKFAKELSTGITPQELHKRLTRKYDKTYMSNK